MVIVTERDFFIEVCRLMGWVPTDWRLAVFEFWARQESPGELFVKARNPLATTWYSGETPLDWGFDIGFGPGNWNSVPVRVYRDYETGARATALTLSLFWYPNVRRCFEDQAGYVEAIGPRDFTSWAGGDAYGRRIVEFMNSTTASRERPGPAFTLTADMLNAVLQDRMALRRLAEDVDNIQVSRAVEILRREGFTL